jgi:two-component system, NarL family, invasion response regulator UvrY
MQSALSLKNVLIAEDHPLVLLGVKQALIEVFPDIEVTRADNFSKTLKAIENQEFDLLVLDINIPGGDKVEMITLIRQRAPILPILVNSSYDESLYALPYLRAGANGFISKTASSEEFKAAVEAIITHRVYASPSVLQNAFGQVNHAGHKSSAINRLTDRELDIAKLLSNGLSTSQISATVNLSPPSVSNYKARIFEKLGVDNVIKLRTYFEIEEGK